MRKLARAMGLLPLALFFALPLSASAQAPVDARRALSSFPDSQAVLFINARRIVNEMLPRVMPPAEYRKMLAQAQNGGFDPRGLEYAAIGMRFAEPAPTGGLPEFVVLIKGGFNADALLSLARVALSAQSAKTRQESYGSKSIEIIDTATLGKIFDEEDGDNQKLRSVPYPEIGLTTLDANTLVVGVPAYVRSAIDAASGRGGLKASTLDLASRDPQALWSLTADIPPTITDTIHKLGAPPNEELDQMLSWIKQVSLSQGMDAASFTLRAAVLTDEAEHASAFSGLVRMGILAAQTQLGQEAAKKKGKDADEARQALSVLKTVVNRTDGSTLLISASVPQTTVAAMVRKQMTKPTTATTGRTTRRTPRRRTTGRH